MSPPRPKIVLFSLARNRRNVLMTDSNARALTITAPSESASPARELVVEQLDGGDDGVVLFTFCVRSVARRTEGGSALA